MDLPLARETLSDSVFELVRNADLNTLTSKYVRTQLESKHELSLREHKAQIDEIIRECLLRARTNEADAKTTDESSAASSPIKKPPATNGVAKATPTNNNHEDNERENSSGGSTPPPDDYFTAQIADDIDVYSAVKRRREAQRSSQRKPPAKKPKRDSASKSATTKKTAFTRICVLSDELSAVLNRRYMRRSDVVK